MEFGKKKLFNQNMSPTKMSQLMLAHIPTILMRQLPNSTTFDCQQNSVGY